jgi:hypothetical protein
MFPRSTLIYVEGTPTLFAHAGPSALASLSSITKNVSCFNRDAPRGCVSKFGGWIPENRCSPSARRTGATTKRISSIWQPSDKVARARSKGSNARQP